MPSCCRAHKEAQQGCYTTLSLIQAFVLGRLILLDKNPGVRPVGIGQGLGRVVSSAITTLLKPELVEATTPLHTAAGLSGGIEASVHAMRRIYEDDETEKILLVDAANAFNALNGKAALHNVQYTCPELITFVNNLYGSEAELFIPNSSEKIYSREGTTQGGPESMGFYAASLTTLSNQDSSAANVKKIFYADDGSAGGILDPLLKWLDDLKLKGPLLGYYPEPAKTWLVVKPGYEECAPREIFTDIKIATAGRKFLGSFIGSPEATSAFVGEKIS